MDDRELRSRIKRIDPVSSGIEIKSVGDESSQAILEKIMDQPINAKSNRSMQMLIAAAAVVALVVGGFAVFGGGSDPGVVAASEPLQLGLGESDAMASCIAASADILADVPLAFAGTATAVEGEKVTMTVDEWYVGGDAATVELAAPDGLQALIGGIDFEEGSTYLISAYDGTVNYCGLSGEATPDLQAMYDEAFGA